MEDFYSSNGQPSSEDNSVVEYEIVDEHGNQIMISGAEQLKKLAACVNEIRQSDGSIVKEYILNDPDIIEQIRQQIKDQSSSESVTPTKQQQQPPPPLSLAVNSKKPPQQTQNNNQYILFKKKKFFSNKKNF